MALREELRNIDPEAVLSALSGQVTTEPFIDSSEQTDWIRTHSDLLKEYPALDEIFRFICTVPLGSEKLTDQESAAFIAGAGLGLLAVKAIANSQVFEGLETPPDLED